MAYTDLFVAPINATRKEDYAAFCQTTQRMILDAGAIACSDFWADDVPDGKLTSLPLAVKLEEGEVVTMGWITWPDKATRDAAWAKMMEEGAHMEMPFDGKRMIHGGFVPLVETSA